MIMNTLTTSPFLQQRNGADTCVITNGIPKSGTYFINKIVAYLGHWENSRVHIIPGEYYTVPPEGDFIYIQCPEHHTVQRLLNGQFMAAHLPWTQKLEDVMRESTPTRCIKHILLYRDPRDMLVSYTRFVTNSPTYRRTAVARARQNFMRSNFSTDKERLTYIIQERLDNYSTKYDYLQYESWLRSPQCCAIRFESLYKEFRELPRNGLGDVLNRLLAYLNVDVNSIDPIDFHRNVFGKSLTASGEENKIGQYTRYFEAHHYEMLKQSNYPKAIENFGYS
ncbi:MAG: hypothetical protein D3916_05565 [Candidatus Electrothrix sp. MAN1_4]|nr:hypothetical protein [Candidatus Electrothrix sp. MAN1_4]